MKFTASLILVSLLIMASGCQEEPPAPPATPVSSAAETASAQPLATEGSDKPAPPSQEQGLPQPPIFEDFQGQPQLSLFPRVGDFRPADGSEQLPFWNTFIEHLIKVTGVAENSTTGNRAWAFRGINTIDSVGYFSPLAVSPQTSYQVSFRITTDLADGASAGIGILEFDEFLWVGEQYSEELFNKHIRNTLEGRRLSGTNDNLHQSFSFTTGPETRMIHLVLYREGSNDRNNVMFDELGIAKTP